MAFPRKKKSELKPGSEALQGLFENGKTPLSQQFLRWKIWKKWGDFVGPTISKHSEPVGYFRGTLYLWVENSSWMQQMVFMKDPLVETINKKLGFAFVRNIYLTLDKKSVPRDAEEARELKNAIGKISMDEDL